MKLECLHAQTCLPDYWGGHHLAHVSVPVVSGMTADQLRKDLKSEISQGAIAGSDMRFYESLEAYDEACWEAARQAIDELHIIDGPLFLGLTDNQEGDDSVYAYFVFRDKE